MYKLLLLAESLCALVTIYATFDPVKLGDDQWRSESSEMDWLSIVVTASVASLFTWPFMYHVPLRCSGSQIHSRCFSLPDSSPSKQRWNPTFPRL